jgi:replicative DNA helicase
MRKRIEEYKAKKAAGIQTGLLYGFKRLDEATLGLQPHQYVTIAGWTGIGKSTLGMIFSVQHYIDGFTPMIISLEMDEDEIYRKLDGIAVGLKQHALKEMILHPNEMQRWEEFAERAEEAANNIIVVDIETATPERVYAETAKWNPDVVVVDYIQMMEGPKHLRTTWERVDHCSRALKAQARTMKIPLYGLAQTNVEGESGAKLSNLGGAKAIGFHSDVVFGMKQDESMQAMKKMEISIEKNRNGPSNVIQSVYWDQSNSVFKEWDGKYAYEGVEV